MTLKQLQDVRLCWSSNRNAKLKELNKISLLRKRTRKVTTTQIALVVVNKKRTHEIATEIKLLRAMIGELKTAREVSVMLAISAVVVAGEAVIKAIGRQIINVAVAKEVEDNVGVKAAVVEVTETITSVMSLTKIGTTPLETR